MAKHRYVIGLDFGTNSARALVADAANGREIATSVADYAHGRAGVILDAKDPNLARQHPQDYLDSAARCVKAALKAAGARKGFSAADVIGIGVDTTGSTPMPVTAEGEPLAFSKRFAKNPAAMAWLWKDHTSYAEAAEITAAARKLRPQYLAKCGGTYSSEWFWSKMLHCKRTAPAVFDAAHTWVEIADWIPAVLTGTTAPDAVKRSICAAGHKAMFNPSWGGYPDARFLGTIDKGLARVRETLGDVAYTVADTAGALTGEWARKLGVPAGIPVAVGAFDAHLGAVGSGIEPGVLVKIMGTSTCDVAVWPLSERLRDVPGLCGIVPGSVLPDAYGLEAGQSAVGDIFNWFVERIAPGGAKGGSHAALTRAAAKLAPGESGLLSLDWHNGNRTVLVDQRLTGLIVGMTLHTTPGEIYRALIEATAFGARVIIERFEEFGVKIGRVVNCGGIAAKNPLVMQIYADITGRSMEVSRSDQTCALGAAMAGAVVAGKAAGGHDDFKAAARAMTGVKPKKFSPQAKSVKTYDKLYALYRQLHDSFGTKNYNRNLFGVMKDLLAIRDEARK